MSLIECASVPFVKLAGGGYAINRDILFVCEQSITLKYCVVVITAV